MLVRQFVAVREDRRLLVTVAEQAVRDPLTGLANRVLFLDRLDRAVALRARLTRPVAIVSVDLDDFKLINDSLGHAAGDALLVRVSERLLGAVRSVDTVSRLGGDEFAILVEEGCGHPGLIAHRVAEAFDTAFRIDGTDLRIRPSIGLAVLPAEDTDTSSERLLKQADIAMYSAKRAGDGRVHTFTADMPLAQPGLHLGLRSRASRSPGSDRLVVLDAGSIATDPETPAALRARQLRDAIDQGRLVVHYQPTIDLRSGHLAGAEALVRWPHPQRGLLYPAEFLDVVRDHGLTTLLTQFVLETAISDAVTWKSRGYSVPVTINVFANEVRDVTLPTRVSRALAQHDLAAGTLTVDITEKHLQADPDLVAPVLQGLRELGVRVAIDDFGAETTHLLLLEELPIDAVKLDRTLIAPIAHDPQAAAITRSIIDLAHTLGLSTVAEGVEDAATATVLSSYGCDAAQGHYFGTPVASSQLLDKLTRT